MTSDDVDSAKKAATVMDPDRYVQGWSRTYSIGDVILILGVYYKRCLDRIVILI